MLMVSIIIRKEFDVEESKLKTSAFEYLIAKGDLEVKDNSALNEEIKQKAASKRKKTRERARAKPNLKTAASINKEGAISALCHIWRKHNG
ncbi:UNVERIFIED_ASMBLY: hypothetical protein SD1_07 [Shigella phage 2019SD1]|uniref:Uncharacterized protein n=1 Tax=Shigella phage 2019SD1 TaxID=2848074 RepID=A0A6M5CCL9_9CAUD|nr:hypothetical protein H1N84_gp07 [Shigella phage 2019SD1]